MDDEKWRTDTAERPAVGGPPPRAQPYAPVPPPPRRPADRPVRRERTPLPGWIAWVIVGLLLVTAAVVGAQLVLQPPGTSTAVDSTEATDEQPPDEDEAAASDPSQEATPEAEPSDAEPSDPEPSAEEPAPESTPLAGMASVTVPAAAPPNNDVTGERVTFAGTNMLDGEDETSWRMAGDASGRTITFTFDEPVTITSIGILNGYAKISPDASGQLFDWYSGNRRLRRVEWALGDQVVTVDYGDVAQVQLIDVEPTETTTVELRLIAVSPPGTGPTSRDYTAISEVAFNGYPS